MPNLLKNSAGFSALEVALVVIVMGLLGGSGYYVYQKQAATNAGTSNTPPVTSDTPTKSADLTTLIERVSQTVTSQHAQLAAERSKNDTTSNLAGIAYTVPGYAFLPNITRLDTGVTFYDKSTPLFAQNAKDVPTNTAAIVQQVLFDAGAVRVDSPLDIAQFGADGSLSGYFAFTNAVCKLHQGASNKTYVVVSCASTSDLAAAAAAAKPFAAQLAAATTTAVKKLVIENPQISTNKSGTYERAVMQVNSRHAIDQGAGLDGAHYFYRTVGARDWTYYGSTQEGIQCDQTKTKPGAYEAFADICTGDY